MIDLDELDRLASNATPGPWTTEKPKASDDGWANGVVIAATYGGQGIFAKNGKAARLKPTGRVYADPPSGQMPAADQKFIAACREAMPELIAEVKLARAHKALLGSLAAKVVEAYASVLSVEMKQPALNALAQAVDDLYVALNKAGL